MKQVDFENTYWYIKGYGAGERYLENTINANKNIKPTPPKGASECWLQGFKDALI